LEEHAAVKRLPLLQVVAFTGVRKTWRDWSSALKQYKFY
jgi:hypothetical protein